MKAYCYIIFSKKLNRFYIGACHDDLESRIQKHNEHTYGTHRFTAAAQDWELFLDIQVEEYSHAIRIERHIKSMKSSKYIWNLKQYPEMLKKLIIKTSP